MAALSSSPASSTADAPPPARQGLFGRLGLLLLLTGVATIIAGTLHRLGPLKGAPYAWLHPLQMLRGDLSQAFSPFLLGVAFLLGLAARDRGSQIQPSLGCDVAFRTEGRRLGSAIVGTLVLLLADLAYFPAHNAFDHFVVAALGAALGWWGPRLVRSASVRAIGEFAFTLLVFTLISYAFTVVKAHLFLVRPPNDAPLIALGGSIGGEPLHRVIAQWASTHPDFVVLCDRVYFRLFEHMAVVSCFLTGLGRPETRQRYLSSLSVAYLAGACLYFVLPALGPVYADPEAYAFLRALPLDVNEVQPLLLRSTNAVREGRSDGIATYAYIAAMPSLHLAHEFVMLFYARASRPFFAANALFTALTAVAVVVLGWHYAIDIVGGAILAAFSIALAERKSIPWMPASLRPPLPALAPTSETIAEGDAPTLTSP
jgi:hypothetical protein